jgi:hypothetical protein
VFRKRAFCVTAGVQRVWVGGWVGVGCGCGCMCLCCGGGGGEGVGGWVLGDGCWVCVCVYVCVYVGTFDKRMRL